jgi:hypothetical protein
MAPPPAPDDVVASAGPGGPGVGRTIVELAQSARTAGRAAVTSGRWLADTVVELAPRVPVRDAATLSAHHDGATDGALAKALVRSAARVSAGIGAATGTAIAAQQLSVAMVVLVPFELAAETALAVLTELKLIAELHEVAGRRVTTRSALLVWASGHALPPSAGEEADDGPALGPAARRQLVAQLRARYARNLATLGPLLTGAAAAGLLNRRATVTLGNAVARDLGLRRAWGGGGR